MSSNQYSIPCILMRGGTSKGPFFYAQDLPANIAERDALLLGALGSPDRRQIDGIGGAHSLTSKVGIVDVCETDEADLTFLFAQLQPDKNTVDTTPNCGNMLAAVVPYALEKGLVKAQGPTSTFKVLTVNTNMVSEIEVQTPHGQITYEGEATINGVPGSSAPITINFLDVAGSVAGSLLPTGNLIDTFDIEGIGPLLAAPIDGGAVHTRCYIPHVCHEAIGVLAAVTVATACILPNTVAAGMAKQGSGLRQLYSIEHST